MNKKQLLKYTVVFFVVAIMTVITCCCQLYNGKNIILSMDVDKDTCAGEEFSVYYTTKENQEFTDEMKVSMTIAYEGDSLYQFALPNNVQRIRLDPGTKVSTVTLRNIMFSYGSRDLEIGDRIGDDIESTHDISGYTYQENMLTLQTEGTDPYFVWDISDWGMNEYASKHIQNMNWVIKIAADIIALLLLIVYLKKFDFFVEFPAEIYHSKRLILQLSKNDFKTKYAGSYLGIVWAFVQPIVTVVLYWFVFEKGLRAGSMVSVPFVLWLIAGLVPWFFFSDAVPGGTNALIEYQYLVKKVVFQIDILPLVKVFSAMFVHVFFVVFMLILYSCYGYFPSMYTLQILYYSFCTFVLALGIVYATSAVVGFFRDLSQIINIALQVGTWLTPIMWNFDSMNLPGWLRLIFQMNPMFYIVQGYRDALIDHVWFWERPGITLYFWMITVSILGIGTMIFKKLKIHFADVL
ncbi:MAG: ABC transporter permease [Lachnospiraceae bacterium]